MKLAEMNARLATMTPAQIAKVRTMIVQGYGAHGISQNYDVTVKQANAVFEFHRLESFANANDRTMKTGAERTAEKLAAMTTQELAAKAERLRTNWDRACFQPNWRELRANIEKLQEAVAVELFKRHDAAAEADILNDLRKEETRLVSIIQSDYTNDGENAHAWASLEQVRADMTRYEVTA
jgi:hypothetical protein